MTPAPALPVTPDALVEIEAIKRCKYRYLRCLDQKLWDELDDVLTEDCVAEYAGGAHTHHGRAAIVAFLRETMGRETFLSSHRCHHPEIDLTGPDAAVGTWAMDDVVILTDLDLTIRGAAFYTDEYRRTAAGWRLARTGYRRTFEEVQPRGPVTGLRLTAHWHATGGRSELGT